MSEKSLLVVGLGRMGGGIVRRLINYNVSVYVFDRTYEKAKGYEKLSKYCKAIKTIEEVRNLKGVRVVWLMLPSGDITQSYIEKFCELLSPGDIIIDGGNSKWSISKNNYEKLREKNINFLDAGVSGGIWGEKNGYCIMVGGDFEAYKTCEEYFKVLSSENGYLYCGLGGSGHFVKMVHNGIEYAMMQAYAEGFEMIRSFEGIKAKKYEIARLFNNGSVIRSWLLELIYNALKDDDELSDIKGYVEDSGEGKWSIEYALSKSISCETIAASVFRRFRSRMENPFSERLLAVMREQFGGHKVYKKDGR